MVDPSGWSIFRFAGKVLSGGMDWIRRRFKKADEIHQLCTVVAFALEEYAADCYDASHDSGIENPDGTVDARVDAPVLDLQKLKPDWLLLSADLRYRVIELPEKIRRINGFLSASWDNATAPDYAEYFWDRQKEYARIGESASRLAMDIRSYGRLPIDASAGGILQNLLDRQERIRQIEDEHERRAAAWRDQLAKFGPPDELETLTAAHQAGVTYASFLAARKGD